MSIPRLSCVHMMKIRVFFIYLCIRLDDESSIMVWYYYLFQDLLVQKRWNEHEKQRIKQEKVGSVIIFHQYPHICRLLIALDAYWSSFYSLSHRYSASDYIIGLDNLTYRTSSMSIWPRELKNSDATVWDMVWSCAEATSMRWESYCMINNIPHLSCYTKTMRYTIITRIVIQQIRSFVFCSSILV